MRRPRSAARRCLVYIAGFSLPIEAKVLYRYYMRQSDGPFFVGVDGGGSTSRACVADASGYILGRAKGGSANLTTNFERGKENINATVDAAYRSAGLSGDSRSSDFAFLGIAGASIGTVADDLRSSVGFADAQVTTDREITVAGALGERDGSVAMIGTGSFFSSQIDHENTNVGGWGFPLGDDCGGAYLGRKLLRNVILAYDGVIETSPLTTEILNGFDGDPKALVAFAATATPYEYGQFAPALVAALAVQDPVATSIFDDATGRLVRFLETINALDLGHLCMLGGLGSTYRKLLPPQYLEICVEPAGGPLDGAILKALQTWGNA